jgi:hypothetical protein
MYTPRLDDFYIISLQKNYQFVKFICLRPLRLQPPRAASADKHTTSLPGSPWVERENLKVV